MTSTRIADWAFTLAADTASAEPITVAAKGFDDRAWRRVTVPHDWSIGLPFTESAASGTGYLPGGVGWYRAHVPLSGLGIPEGGGLRLVFHGVYKNADVWVNGYHLGGRPSGWARMAFDLGELLDYAPDDDLVIAVRVDRAELADSRWYNGAGITRHVELHALAPVRIADVGTDFVTVTADATRAEVRIAQRIENSTADAVTVGVRHELQPVDGGAVHVEESTLEVPARGSVDHEVTAHIVAPRLWSDTSPELSRLTTTLTWDGGNAVDEQIVGIRTFRFDPATGFSINGEARTLQGVCLHEDAGPLGVAVPPEVWLRRLETLRGLGVNAVRMAHNPHAPELYALCDALGFFVIDEAFDEWENAKNKWWQGHNVYPPKLDGPAEHFPAWHERDLVDLITAHRLHPSVIAWSIGNEVDYPNDPYASPMFEEMTGNNDANKPAAERVYDPNRPDVRRLSTIARRLGAIARRTDPTRPVTLASAFPELSSRTGLLDDLDVIGYNYKEHLYEDDHGRFPQHPFIGSENGHGYAQWRAVVDHDFVGGQFLWTGIDYLGEAHGWPVHGSGAGLLDLAGFEKPGAQLRRSWWTREPMVHVVTRTPEVEGRADLRGRPATRSWVGDEPVEVLVFSTADEVRLSSGGAQLPVTRDAENGWWSCVATPGTEPLIAEALRGDEVVARDELRAAGPAARLDVVRWTPSEDAAARLAAAGVVLGEVAQLEATLVDADGRPSLDDRLVVAEVDGGELIGLENGDLGDVTAYSVPERRTVGGHLAVFVAGAGATVRLHAEGLPPASIEC